MAWSFQSGVSVTVQIVDRLRTAIISGEYQSGAQFPTVRALATEAAVNPNTMQKALALLESEGLIVTRGTSGRWVTDDAVAIEESRRTQLGRFVRMMIDEAQRGGIGRDELVEEILKGWTLI